MLITAPDCILTDAPIQNHLDGLVDLGYTSAAAVHADYVTATRAVAAELSVELFDAAHYFAHEIRGCDYFLPESDPVHMTGAGLAILADQLAKQLVATGWMAAEKTSPRDKMVSDKSQ
jgi:lysophospholipase L1-like esterase